MIKKQKFLIIGLGVFGTTIASELAGLGHHVTGVDISEKRVNQVSDVITQAVIADVTDRKALEGLDAGDYDVGVVAIGDNLEPAILATLHLREMGVEKVWAKALTTEHERILEKLGATRVIGPEFEMGRAIAQELTYPLVRNYIDLDDDEYLMEMVVSEDLDGITVDELRGDTDVLVVMTKRGKQVQREPEDDSRLREGDQVVLAGPLSELHRLADHLL